MPAQSTHSPTTQISRREALRFWLRLGFISFGGPAGQIAIMHRELVELRRWVSDARFLHALNYCMVLPGPEAQQLATYLGWLMHGTIGGIVAGVLFVLPSLLILILLSWVYVALGDTGFVKALFSGIKPAVIAIVLAAAWRIGTKALNSVALVTIAIASFVAMFVFNVPFPFILLCAALAGWLGGRYLPTAFASFKLHEKNLHVGVSATQGYIIDDHTPPPPHARIARGQLGWLIVVCVLLWLLPFGLIFYGAGADSTLTHMSTFFTKAALLTFGGAYAVLPYVVDGAVSHYQWLTPAQMLDGMALGETTPGPLIMIVAFVAYLGGTANMVAGDSAFLSGALAALIVTYFTFLPSFFFILVGAPLIESTRNKLNLTAPMSAMTAAVVGVIVNLALFFAAHVWWPEIEKSNTVAGFQAFMAVDWLAVLISIIAATALLRYKAAVITVIGAAAAFGTVVWIAR